MSNPNLFLRFYDIMQVLIIKKVNGLIAHQASDPHATSKNLFDLILERVMCVRPLLLAHAILWNDFSVTD